MFFILSKILWVLTTPANLITLAHVGAALLFASGRPFLGRSRRRVAFASDPAPRGDKNFGARPQTVPSRFRFGRALVVAAAVSLVAFGVLPVGALMLRVLENRFPQAALTDEAPTGIIVLGGAIDQVTGAGRGQVAIKESATRITEAVVLARRYPAARLFYSGGSNELVSSVGSEAGDAKRLWVAMGVDPDRISFEDRSRNTDENARFSREALRPTPDERWLLVTSAYHMPRSVGLFRAAGFHVVPVPVDYRTIGTWRDLRPNLDASVGLAQFDFATREWIGLLAYWLTGKIASVFPGP